MIVALALLATLQQPAQGSLPNDAYLFFVASEWRDQVALVRFGKNGVRVEHRTPIRLPSVDAINPRELRVAPDGRSYFVVTSHGFPSGELIKFRISDDIPGVFQRPDTVVAREPLGAFPAALDVTPDGEYAWVTNAAAAGTSQPSWISVVYLRQMIELERIPTCPAPRGGRFSADGSRFYATCSGSDELVEFDARAMKEARRLTLHAAGSADCGSSAAVPGADGTRLLVACARTGELLEVDVGAWSVTRRIRVGPSPSTIAVSRDGATAVVGNGGNQTVSLVDLAAGRELTQLPTIYAFSVNFSLTAGDPFLPFHVAVEFAWTRAMRRVPTGIVITPDGRYALVSVGGVGAELGGVDVIEIATGKIVAIADVGAGAHGIDFWKIDRATRPN